MLICVFFVFLLLISIQVLLFGEQTKLEPTANRTVLFKYCTNIAPNLILNKSMQQVRIHFYYKH